MKSIPKALPDDEDDSIILVSSLFALSRSPEHLLLLRFASCEPIPMGSIYTCPRFVVWNYQPRISDTEVNCSLLVHSTSLTKWKEIYIDLADSVFVFRCPTATGGRSHPIEDFADYCIFLLITGEFDNQFEALARQFLDNCAEAEMNRRKATFPAHCAALGELSEQVVKSMSPKALSVLLALYSLTGTPSENAILAVQRLKTPKNICREFPVFERFAKDAFEKIWKKIQEPGGPASAEKTAAKGRVDIPHKKADRESAISTLRRTESLPALIQTAGKLANTSTREWQPEFNLLAASLLQKGAVSADEIVAEISQLSERAKAFMRTSVLGKYCLEIQSCRRDPSRSVTVYFATCPQETGFTICIATACGNATLGLVQWENPLSHPYQLWSGECPAEDKDTQFSIIVKQEKGLTLTEPTNVRRVIPKETNKCYIFSSSLQSPILTASSKWRSTDTRFSFKLYLMYLLVKGDDLKETENLFAQSEIAVDFSEVIGLMCQLESVKSLRHTDEMILTAVQFLDSCVDPAAVITQCWELLRLSIDILRTAPLHSASERVYRGYAEIMKVCVAARRPEWLLILQRVPLAEESQRFFVSFFEEIAESDATYIVGEMLDRKLAIGGRYLEFLLRHLANVRTFLSTISLFIQNGGANKTEADYLALINSYFEGKTMRTEEVEEVYLQFVGFSEQTRNVLIKSSLTNCVEGALKRNIEKKWTSLYQTMLLGQGKQLVPNLDSAEFAFDLIAIHGFDFFSTYSTFKSLIPEVTETFRAWMQLQRHRPLQEFLPMCDVELSQCQGQEFERRIAILAANETYATCRDLVPYLTFCSEYRFASQTFDECCRQKGEKAIQEKMQPTIISNALLSQITALFMTNASFASYFSIAVRCLQPSSPEGLLTALLSSTEENTYWVALFQNSESSSNPAVVACAECCVEVARRLTLGSISYQHICVLLNDEKAAQIFAFISAASGWTDFAQFSGWCKYWDDGMNACRDSIQWLQLYIAGLFPGTSLPRDVQRFFPNEYPQYATEPVDSLISLPASLQQCLPRMTLYDELFRSEIYLALVKEMSGDPAQLQAERFAEILEEAKVELEKRLRELAKPPGEVLMSQVTSVFGNVQNIDLEIGVLRDIVPEFQLDLVHAGLSHFRSLRNMQVLCEAVTSCESVLQFADHEALDACRRFRDAVIEAQGEYTLAQIMNIADTLPSVCTVDVATYQDAVEVLTAIGQHGAVMRQILVKDQENLQEMMEMIATQDDVRIDTRMVDNFMTAGNFLRDIVGIDNVNELLIRVKTLIARNLEIGKLLRYCVENMPLLEGIGDIFNITEKTKIEWMLAMLSASEAMFKGETNEVQLSISFSISDSPPYIKEADELDALHSQCALILASSDSEEYREKLQAFHLLLPLLFQVQSKINELDSLGADIREFRRGRMCHIASDRSEEAEALDRQLSQELAIWKGLPVDSYPLTYLFGDHIWTMEKAFLKDYRLSDLEAQQTSAWAEAMGKKLENPAMNDPQDGTVQRLTQLAASLSRLPNRAEFARNFSYQQDMQDVLPFSQQILYFETTETFPALIAAYVKQRLNLPKSHQVMVCMENSTVGELFSFLRHCFTCERPDLFALLHCDRLRNPVQTEGIRLLEALLPLRSPANFLVVAEDSKGHFAHFIRTEIRARTVRELDASYLLPKMPCVQEVAPETRVMISGFAGLGKTQYVLMQAETNLKPLFIFPVSGELEAEALGLSLCEKRITENSIILIQIGYVETASHQVLANFLLQMVVLTSFKTRKHFFLMPAGCQVFFELQNTPTNQWVLLHSPLKHLQFVHFPNINWFLPRESDVQVLSYLDVYSRNSAYLVSEVTSTVANEYCQQLIDSCFAAPCRARGDSVSFRSVKCFLNFLSSQVKGMAMSPFVPSDPELAQFRPTIFKCLVQSTMEYTAKSMKMVRSGNKVAVDGKHIDIPEGTNILCAVSWNGSNHDNVFFTESGQLVFIYKSQSRANPDLIQLFYSQQQSLPNRPPLPDYDQMRSDELIEHLRSIHCPARTLPDTKYVMTPDNFLKMNLIYTRMLAGIPIVCMGESGCGKTHLLNFLVNTLLGETLEVVNIHAGVTATDIMQKMGEIVQRAQNPGRVWVFFDEFNTSSCIGMVSEIVCDRRLNGVKLPDNIVFVAACNPYRLKSPAQLNAKRAGIKHKNEDLTQRLLVHVVKPLPECLLEYVWDFGALAKPDLKKYIYNILIGDNVERPENYCEAIFYAHEFLADNQEAICVSLRDVKRFVIIYKWLLEAMQAKSHFPPKPTERRQLSIAPGVAALPLDVKAGTVAFYLAYIMRVSVQVHRDQLVRETAEKLGVQSLQQVVQAEQDDLIARMKLPADIVANEALRENLYTLFVCIYTRIPVILCGKPGCSKSLAYQCLFDNCMHQSSSDEWLKTLPRLHLVYYQGSDSCTSDAILRSFARAKNLNEALADRRNAAPANRLAVVVFDEIGLAELSVQNPLKVLHKELELNNAEARQGVSFVGISNWALDASKMNRMLHISRPDPTAEEVQYTARNIFNALARDESKQYVAIAEAAAIAYSMIKLEIQNQAWEDFYGLRDFYHLIKLIVRSLNALTDLSEENIARVVSISVQRNFGGRKAIATSAWQYIVGQYRPFQRYSGLPLCGVLDLVAANLADKDSRYLMVITDGELAEYVLEHQIRVDLHKQMILMGSTLPGDTNSDTYARRRLSDMITYMDRGTPVILKNMDQIYSSLYDLFNQNFKHTSMGKFCRVAIGSSFKPRCFVNDNFHVILIVNASEDTINLMDAPFLNRFEKHIFDLNLLLTPEKKALAERVDAWVKTVVHPGGHSIIPTTALIFPTYNPAAVQLDIFRETRNIPEEKLLLNLKRKLIQAAPRDLLVLAESIVGAESQHIKQIWRKTHSASFEQTIGTILNDQFSLHLVFTYGFEEIKNGEVKTQYLAKCNSEDDLVSVVKLYLKDQTAKLYCLVLDYATEHKHFSFVKHTLQRLCQDREPAGRKASKLALIVIQQRNIQLEATSSDYTGWAVHSVDCFGRDSVDVTDRMLRMNCMELITLSQLLDFRASLRAMLYPLVFQFKYEAGALIADRSYINVHMFFLIENFEKHAGLVEAFRDKTNHYLQTGKIPEKDWKECIFQDPQCVDRCKSMHSAIRYVLEQSVKKAMAMSLYIVETKLALRSFFSMWTEPEGAILREMWLNYFEQMEPKVIENLQSTFQSIKVSFGVLLNFPFSLFDYELLKKPELQQSAEKFIELFPSRTVTKGFLKHMNSSPRLQHLYFSDIVSIAIWKEQFSPEIEDLMLRLVIALTDEGTDFVLKVWRLVSNWPLLNRYCRFVLLYAEFANEQVGNLHSTFLWKKALRRLPEKVTTLPKNLPELEYTPRKYKDVHELYGLAFVGNNSSAMQWKKELMDHANKSILLLYPTKKTADQLPMAMWPQWLSRFVNELKEFEGPLPFLPTLETLSRFPVYTESRETFEFFVKVCDIAAENPKEPIFGSKKMQKKLLKRVDRLQPRVPEATFTFRALLLAEMIKNNAVSVPTLASQVNAEDGFWKYSTVAIDALVDCSKLREDCTQLVGFHGRDLTTLLVKNEWVAAIEDLLKKKPGLDSHFAVLLSDRCLTALPSSIEFTEDLFVDNYASFGLCEALSQRKAKELPQTNTLVFMTFMRWFLQVYCWVIATPSISTDKSKSFRNLLSDVLLRNELLRKVCLIHLNSTLTLQGSSLPVFVSQPIDVPWLSPLKEELLRAQNSEFYFRLPPGKVFLQTTEALREIRVAQRENAATERSLLDALDSVSTPEERLQFALAFVAQVSLCRGSSPLSLQAAKKAISHKLGKTMAALLEAILQNFSPGNFAHIPSGCTESEKQHRVAVHCLLAVITAFADVDGCLTSVFFPSGREASGKYFKQLYVPGAPHAPLYEHLYAVQTNPGQFAATSWYDCGNCENIYAIGNCGRPMEERKCPYCSYAIGGQNHELVVRPGHRQIPNNEVAKEAADRVKRYLASKQQPGMSSDSLAFDTAGMRGISPLSLQLLRYIVKCYLNFLCVWCNDASFKSAFQYPGPAYFDTTLKESLGLIRAQLNCDEDYLWVFQLASSLPEFLQSQKYSLRTPAERTRFEQAFDAALVKPHTSNRVEVVRRYKAAVSQASCKFYEEAEIYVTQDPNIRFFRLTRDPSAELLISTWTLNPMPVEYPALQVVITSFKSYSTLQSILPILEFTKYLTEKYSHRLSRQEARARPLKDFIAKDAMIRQLFREFLKVWESINSDLAYACHQLNPITFSEDTEICYFLPDTKENGGGLYMCAALYSLADRQNKLLESLAGAVSQHIPAQSSMDFIKQHIQETAPEHILHCALTDPATLQSSFCNNPAYANGRDVVFNYDRFEQKILADFKQARTLTAENLHLFRYQGEFLTNSAEYSSVIGDIRAAVKQRPLPDEEREKLQQFVDRLKKNDPMRFAVFVQEVHDSLEYVLCIIKNEKVSGTGTIAEVAGRYDVHQVCQRLLQHREIFGIAVHHIVDLYELFEESLFLNFKVDSRFKDKDSTNVAARCVARVRDLGNSVPPLTQVRAAVMRLIVRLLDESMKESESLGQFILKPDLWPEDVDDEKLERVSEEFTEVQLRYVQKVYELLDRQIGKAR